MTHSCLCCGREDDRTRLGSLWCMDHFVLPLAERLSLAIVRERESEAIEGFERAA